MVRKHQKISNFSQRNSHTASTKPIMNNCNHSELLKENSPGEVSNKQPQINYKSTCDNKCETTRAKNNTTK